MINFKKYLPRSLFGRSMLIIVVPALLLQLLTTFVFYDRHWNRLADRLADALVGEIAIVINDLENSSIPPERADVIDDITKNFLSLKIELLKADTLPPNEYRGIRHGLVAKTLTKAMDKEITAPYTFQIGVVDKKNIDIYIQTRAGVLKVMVPENRLFSSSSYIFVLWMVGFSVILFSIAIIFMRNQIRPIRRLAVAADWFGRGKEVSNFKPEGAREVRQAAKAFITMKERIKRQMSQRTLMLAGVSHDLRTPLTRVKLELEMLKDKESKKLIQRDLQEMEDMIDGYLDFVRTDEEEAAVFANLGGLIEQCIDKNAGQMLNIHFNTEQLVPNIWLRPRTFARCIQNIISNARKYADNLYITLEYQEDKEDIVLMFDDDGPGIDAEHRDDVVKPFFRLEKSRNKKTGGVGLGLTIATDIVNMHGGHLQLDESPQKGLRIILSLPV